MLRTILCAVATLSLGLQAPAADKSGAESEDSHTVRMVSPEQGGPRRWQVAAPDGIAMHDAPASDASVLETLADGTVLSNLGCRDAGGRVWCQVQPLRTRVRGHVEATHLRPARGPDGVVPIGPDDTLQRARKRDFDATGSAPCAQERGQAMGTCGLGVARGSGGDATVAMTFENGFRRMLYFRHGLFIRADTTMSGNGFDTDWHRDGDLHVIRVDDQRFEISDAAVFGR